MAEGLGPVDFSNHIHAFDDLAKGGKALSIRISLASIIQLRLLS